MVSTCHNLLTINAHNLTIFFLFGKVGLQQFQVTSDPSKMLSDSCNNCFLAFECSNRVSKTAIALADLTLSRRPGTSYQIEIHFADRIVNHLYLLFSFVKCVETW